MVTKEQKLGIRQDEGGSGDAVIGQHREKFARRTRCEKGGGVRWRG